MPSLLHDALAIGVPRYRKARELVDPHVEKARIESWHASLDAAGPRALPTQAVPLFERRYEVATSTIGAGPDSAGFPVHVIRPRSHRPETTLYYLHGGGYIAPTDPFHVRYALKLARVLDAEVVIPDYPLAPEHTWRDSHRALVDDLGTRTAIRKRVVVAGDSAGGGLALALTQSLRTLRGHLPSHLLLLSPWVDLTTSTPDTAALQADDPWLFLGKLKAYAEWWAGEPDDLGRPEVSPVWGDLAGLPPTLMICGTRDVLVPGCRLLADRASLTGWELTYLEAPGLIHVFPILPAIPEARQAMRHVREFLAR